jgi:hypothetical protein
VIGYARLQKIQVDTTCGFGGGGTRRNGAMNWPKILAPRGALPFVFAHCGKSRAVRMRSDCDEFNMTARQNPTTLF